MKLLDLFENREANALGVYNAFLGAGFSDAQARALTAEVNRENSLQDRYLYGTHSDPYNRATNVGMISWQGPRHDSFMNFMRDQGRVDDTGNLLPGQDTLNAQAKFVRHEMETDPSYRRTATQFLANPDIDPASAAEVLGDNYIRWRRTDPRYSASGYANINAGYNTLDRALAAAGNNAAPASYVPPTINTPVTPTTRVTTPNAVPNPFTNIPARVNIIPPKFIPKIDVSKLPGPSNAINLKRDYRAEGVPLSSVSTLQKGLTTLGYDVGQHGIDGRYGRDTTAAVRKFQQDYGLQVDGIAGVQTLSAMRNIYDNISLPTRPISPTPRPTTSGSGSPTPMGAQDRTGTGLSMPTPAPTPITPPRPRPSTGTPPPAIGVGPR